MKRRRPLGHRDVLGLAWPIVVSHLSTTLLALVNAIWVGRLGTAELASIGLATTLLYLVTAFPLGLLGAVRTHVAVSTGADRPDEARRFAWQAVWLALGLGVLCLALVPLGPAVFPWLGASPEVVGPASAYHAVRLLAAPLMLVHAALVAVGQGRGDTRTPMLASLVANVVNFVADPILVFGLGPIPALGVGGAALGVALGLLVSLLVLAGPARAWLGPVVGPDRALIRRLWDVGAPQALQFQLDVGSFLVFGALLAAAGDAHLAAHVVVVRVVMSTFLPGQALGEAVAVLVGHALGAGRPGRAVRAVRLAAVQVSVFMAVSGAVLAAVPDLAIGLFGVTPEVADLVRPVLRVYAAAQLFDGLAQVGFGALSGAGDTRFPMKVSILAAWAVKLPVAAVLVLGLHLGVLGAWLGLVAEIVVQVVAVAWRLRSGFARAPSPTVLVAPTA